jgi:hypothetical protein
MTVQGFAFNIAQFCPGELKRGRNGNSGRGQVVQRRGEAKLAAGLLFLVGFLFLFSRHFCLSAGPGKT